MSTKNNCTFVQEHTNPWTRSLIILSLPAKWRFPLVGLLCVLLPFMIFAWGTAYKVSLYKTARGGAPAKVCARGSDAAKSSVSQAIDGRKNIGNSVATSLPVNAPLVLPQPHDVALAEALQVVVPLPPAHF